MHVLNVQSDFDPTEVNSIRQWDFRDDLANPPTPDEVLKALSHLFNGKAAGKSGILPEMVKVNCDIFQSPFCSD